MNPPGKLATEFNQSLRTQTVELIARIQEVFT